MVFYDEAAYELGDRASNVGRIVAPADARALNDFQCANALENVYFIPGSTTAEWLPAAEHIEEIRSAEHVTYEEAPAPAETGKQGVMVTIQTEPDPSHAIVSGNSAGTAASSIRFNPPPSQPGLGISLPPAA